MDSIKMPSKPGFGKLLLAIFFYGIPFGIPAFVIYQMDKKEAIWFSGIVFWLLIGVWIMCILDYYKSSIKDYELAQRDFEAYKKEMLRRKRESERNRNNNNSRPILPRCPVCDANDTMRISTLNRAISVHNVGLASPKIGKQYQCKNCGHMW